MRQRFADALRRVCGGNGRLEDYITIIKTDNYEERQALYRQAAAMRDSCCGRRLLVRGLVEFSNHCGNSCLYCGLNRDNTEIGRYGLDAEAVLECAGRIAAAGISTIVLQSGEDGSPAEWLASIVKEIKRRWNLAVTLSVGERPRADYALWRRAGADRYLLRIESSDAGLYRALHRGREIESRLRCLHDLKELDYQLGSGVMVGLPGQSPEILARDVEFFGRWNFDMIGIGPFIPHPDTVLGLAPAGGIELTLNTVALTRIVMRDSLMPATTALGSLDGDHRLEGLNAGANVIMPCFTPGEKRGLYAIYPGKNSCRRSAAELAEDAGLSLDMGRGDSLKKHTNT